MSQTFDDFVTSPLTAPQPSAAAAPVKVKERKARRMRHASKQDVVDSIRSLAMMLTVQRGELLPVRTLAAQYAGTKLGAAYERIGEQIVTGVPFTTAFSQEGTFPAVARRLVLVGDKTGNPAPHLIKAADLLDETLETSAKVRSALLEPTMLGIAVVAFFIGMVTWAVPQMVDVFAQTGADLPMLTTLAMRVSSVLQLLVPLLAVIGAGVWVWWWRLGSRSPAMRIRFDAMMLRMPVVGRLKREAALSNSFAVLAALLELGVTELDALRTAADGCDNRAIGQYLSEHATEVSQGVRTFADIADGAVIPLPVGAVLGASASSGKIAMGLAHVADTYRRSARVKADNLSTALGPIANIVVGILFAGAVIVIYLPMYSMFAATTAF